jgi:putative ABC transport system permease protein
MIKHAFKLMWNRKRRSLLLTIEIFFCFLVLFVVAGLAIANTVKYLEPLGFKYKNVWLMTMNWRAVENDKSPAEMRATYEQIKREMLAQPQIKAVSMAMGCLPYGGGTWSTDVKYQDIEHHINFSNVDDDFAKVMGIEMQEGRWFDENDNASSRIPIVLNGQAAQEIAGDGSAIGMLLNRGTEHPKELIVTGVIGNYRFKGEFNNHGPLYFERLIYTDSLIWWPDAAIFSVTDDADVQFEQYLLKRLSTVSGGMDLQIETLSDRHAAHIKDMILGLGTVALIAGFLVFNVALGLFGVLWYSISRRRSEMGLRRAVGADARRISFQIILEAMALATFAIIIGVIFAAQVPLLGMDVQVPGGIHVVAMVVAAIMIYVLVTICALYPSHLAAKVQPAEALHDE